MIHQAPVYYYCNGSYSASGQAETSPYLFLLKIHHTGVEVSRKIADVHKHFVNYDILMVHLIILEIIMSRHVIPPLVLYELP